MQASLRNGARRRARNTLIAGALTAAAGLTGPVAAIDIVFDYSFDTNNFFDATRMGILDQAASFFESLITDDLLAITSAGNNSFNARFTHPGTGALQTVNDFSIAADTLVIYAGGRNFGGSTLGQGGPGGFSVSGSQTFVDNAITRGETATTAGVRNEGGQRTAVDFAPWGGSISFDLDNPDWYFDTDPTTNEAFTGNDFYSVALHEIGHVLGVGTSDSWNNKINASNRFTGANAVAAFGGNVRLQAGGGHWANGTNSTVFGTNTPQEAAMDPSLTNNTRKVFTTLDVAGLEDIGWEIQSASAG